MKVTNTINDLFKKIWWDMLLGVKQLKKAYHEKKKIKRHTQEKCETCVKNGKIRITETGGWYGGLDMSLMREE